MRMRVTVTLNPSKCRLKRLARLDSKFLGQKKIPKKEPEKAGIARAGFITM
jgi:hypothetical protein